MKPTTEQVLDLFKRAIKLKADAYLNKVNIQAKAGSKKQVAHAVAAH